MKKKIQQRIFRDYYCDSCNVQFEVHEPFHAKCRKKCPECGKYKLRRLFQIPTLITSVVTLGHWGDINRKKIGISEIQEREAKAEEKKISINEALSQRPLPKGMSRVDKPKNPPWWRPGTKGPDMSINKMTTEQKSKFIQTGQKPA